MSLERFLQLIRDGEPVKAGTANRPTRQLHANVEYIWEVLQAVEVGSTLYARRVTVETAAVKGTPVYFNTTRQRFERGLAVLDSTPTSGVLQTAASAGIWGVVAEKFNDTLADVLLCGYAELDISGVVSGAVTAGLYYLSGQTEGMLVKQRPPVSVPVLRSDGNGKVFLMPQFVDFLDRHVHYKFPLTCAPAGTHTPPDMGEHHVITDGDDSLPGWLPADHEVFEGHAPDGAMFGYNLNAHESLKNAWPPLPTSSASLILLRPIDGSLGGVVPLGPYGKCIIDRYGIWWMTDCFGDVPWPTSYTTGESDTTVYGESECPQPLQMEMTLWFTKLEFATDVSVVRSLRSTDDRLIVTCQDGSPASAGDLIISLDLELVVADDQRGYLFFKELDGNTIKRGPGVEGVYTTSPNVTLSGDASSLIDPEDEESGTMYHGKVHVEVNPAATRELDVALVRLDGAQEEHYSDLMYIGLAAGQEQEYRARIDIPADTALTNPVLSLRLRVLGRASGDLPQLTLTGRRVARPSGVTPLNLPLVGEEFTIVMTTVATLSANNQYVEFESDAFEVAAGDAVYFTVRRESTDEYPAQVGILQQKGILTAS